MFTYRLCSVTLSNLSRLATTLIPLSVQLLDFYRIIACWLSTLNPSSSSFMENNINSWAMFASVKSNKEPNVCALVPARFLSSLNTWFNKRFAPSACRYGVMSYSGPPLRWRRRSRSFGSCGSYQEQMQRMGSLVIAEDSAAKPELIEGYAHLCFEDQGVRCRRREPTTHFSFQAAPFLVFESLKWCS